jgi:hypothetical protein
MLQIQDSLHCHDLGGPDGIKSRAQHGKSGSAVKSESRYFLERTTPADLNISRWLFLVVRPSGAAEYLPSPEVPLKHFVHVPKMGQYLKIPYGTWV